MSLLQHLRDAAVSVASTAQGAKALTEWLGKGGLPVTPEIADARAQVCLTCPKNMDCTSLLADTALAAIREYQQIRHGFKLALPEDNDLKHCSVCSCPLQLKVWVPFEHIAPTVKDYPFPDFCWIYKEAKAAGVPVYSEPLPAGQASEPPAPERVQYVKGEIVQVPRVQYVKGDPTW